MTSRFLLHEDAFGRVKDHLAANKSKAEFVTMRDDGSFWCEGARLAPDDGENTLNIEGAWMSNDLFRSPAARDFAIEILKSPTIKWLQTASAGLDNAFFQDVMNQGVRISNSDAQARAIAEYVLAQVIARYQPIAERAEAQASRAWKRFAFREIYQTRWTIIGFGNIGSEIGKRARGFDAHVTGLRRTPGAHDYADEMASLDDLYDLLPQSDVVVLACPLTEATAGIAGEKFFAAMKDNATLVNIGRGGLVDEAALVRGLEAGKPDFAVLDVFATEPLPETSALWDNPKIAISGHSSAFGSGTARRGDELFLENLENFLAGAPLRNEVDPKRV